MGYRIVSGLCTFLLLVAVVSLSVGVVAADSAAPQAENATVVTNESGPAIATVQPTQAVDRGPNGTAFVWERIDGERASGYQIATSVVSPGANASVCLRANGSVSCAPVGPDGHVNLSTPGADGLASLTVSLSNASSNATLDAETVPLQAIERTGDLDADGLNNSNEIELGTNLTTADSDGDGLTDGAEVHQYGTDPSIADTDEDGLVDAAEVRGGSDPTLADTDRDGLVDERELAVGTNPSAIDTDGDGLTDQREVSGKTDPTVADTDGDGVLDGTELKIGTNPAKADSDGDGIADGRERSLGTNPTVVDTDGDGLSDGAELRAGTEPTVSDTDGDGLADGRELEVGTSPLTVDTDSDGLSDGTEVSTTGTSPLASDSDGDLLSDQQEVTWGTDPNSALTPAWVTSAFLGFVIGIGLTVAAIRRGSLTDLSASLRLFVYRSLEFDREIIEINRQIEAGDEQRGAPDEPMSDAECASDVFERADTELVPDERLVTMMLKAESGRMHQSDIVAATDWSKAKVSRLLSSMADADDVVKIRLGRENLICLERAKPAAATPTHAANPTDGRPPTPGG